MCDTRLPAMEIRNESIVEYSLPLGAPNELLHLLLNSNFFLPYYCVFFTSAI